MLTQGTANAGDSIFYDYRINHSCRFDEASYLSKTFPQNNGTSSFTFSVWIKRSGLSSLMNIISAKNSNTNSSNLSITASDTLVTDKPGVNFHSLPNVLRDTGSWYHIVINYNGTASSIYINGVGSTGSAVTYGNINSNVLHVIGASSQFTAINYFNGYMANLQFIDGQALDPYFFGEMRNNIWIPYNAFTTANSNSVDARSSNGSIADDNYGDNGFHLLFDDPGHATGFGKDSSGKWNHFIESP